MNTSKTVLKMALFGLVVFAGLEASSRSNLKKRNPDGTARAAAVEIVGTSSAVEELHDRKMKRGQRLTAEEATGVVTAPSATVIPEIVPVAAAAVPVVHAKPAPAASPAGALSAEQIAAIQQAVTQGRTVHIPGARDTASTADSLATSIALQTKIKELEATITSLEEALARKDTALADKDTLLNQVTTQLNDALSTLQKAEQKTAPGFISRHKGKLLVMCVTVLYLYTNYETLAALTTEEVKALFTTFTTHKLFGHEVSIPNIFVSFMTGMQKTWETVTSMPAKLAEAYHFAISTLEKIKTIAPTPTPTPLPTVKSGMRCVIQ
ncbi:hypothetical protein FJ365_00785 [Candidatus Dependentiae bacterium]|nr:hypothetical protein [Candidatus Dependentiae bacterium]